MVFNPLFPYPIPGFVMGNTSTHVQPFTFRDGWTMLEKLEALRLYINEITEKYNGINDKLDEAIAEMQLYVDNAIANEQIWVTGQIEALTDYVNEQVQLIINDAIQVQDAVVAGIFGNSSSESREVTDNLYANKATQTTVETGRLSPASVEAAINTEIDETFSTSSIKPETFELETYNRNRILDLPSTPVNIWYGYLMTDKIKAAVERIRTNAGKSRILCIGDSTTAGMGTSTADTVANNSAYPAVLARLLHRNLARAQYGLSIPTAEGHDSEDNRWTLGTGWSRSTIAGIGLGGRRTVYTAVPGSGDLQFLDPRIGADTYDIYYTMGTTGATFTASVGSGPSVVVDTVSPTRKIGKATVTGTSVSTNVPVTIANTGTTGGIYIIGIEPSNSTLSSFIVGNAGVSGSNSETWMQNNGGDDGWNVFGFIAAYQPDVTIIDLGINDSPNTAVVDYMSRMSRIASAARAAGSAVMFKTMIPSAQPRHDRESEFVQALISNGSGQHAILDIFNHYGSYERTNARGWMPDGVHGNDAMYYDEAEKVAEFIFRYAK